MLRRKPLFIYFNLWHPIFGDFFKSACAVCPEPLFALFQSYHDFYPELFPDTASGVPSMTAEQWCNGSNDPVINAHLYFFFASSFQAFVFQFITIWTILFKLSRFFPDAFYK